MLISALVSATIEGLISLDNGLAGKGRGSRLSIVGRGVQRESDIAASNNCRCHCFSLRSLLVADAQANIGNQKGCISDLSY